jgi:DNA-binding CsgD family transcriptional regulator
VTTQQKTLKPARTLKVLSFTEACLGAALACNIAWVRMCFQSLNIYANYNDGEPLLDAMYLLSVLTVTVMLLMIGFFQEKSLHLLKRRKMPFLLSLGMSVSTLLMPLSGLEGSTGTTLWLVSGIASGLFSGLFLIYLGIAYALITTRSIVASTAIGTILASLLFCLFLFFNPLEATFLAGAMPLTSALFLFLGVRSLDGAPDIHSICKQLADERAFAQTIADNNLAVQHERRTLTHLVAIISLCSCLVGFANETARTLFVQLGIVGIVDGRSYAVIQGVAGSVGTVGTVLIAIALFNAQTPKMPKHCYRLMSLFLVIGVAGLPLPFAFPESSVFVPYEMNAASYSCFSLMIWIITAGICNRYFTSILRTFAFIRAGWALGPLLGSAFGRQLFNTFGVTLAVTFSAMIVCIFAILFAILIVFTEDDLMSAMNIIPLERHRRFREKCERVIATYGLSRREGEVMILFAKGRNLAHIQEQLCLSRSTISTHRQHIYQKLNIHSAQELLDLIQSMP